MASQPTRTEVTIFAAVKVSKLASKGGMLPDDVSTPVPNHVLRCLLLLSNTWKQGTWKHYSGCFSLSLEREWEVLIFTC
jgi:hypothetical protein